MIKWPIHSAFDEATNALTAKTLARPTVPVVSPLTRLSLPRTPLFMCVGATAPISPRLWQTALAIGNDANIPPVLRVIATVSLTLNGTYVLKTYAFPPSKVVVSLKLLLSHKRRRIGAVTLTWSGPSIYGKLTSPIVLLTLLTVATAVQGAMPTPKDLRNVPLTNWLRATERSLGLRGTVTHGPTRANNTALMVLDLKARMLDPVVKLASVLKLAHPPATR